MSKAATILPCLFASAPVLLAVSLSAQVAQRGTVSGTVSTAAGTPVASATVNLTGPEGFARRKPAGPDGAFSLLDLPSGTYTVQVTAPGFATATQAAVTVAVGRDTRLSFRLSLAGVKEAVNVNAHNPALDASQTSSVVNVDRDRVEELPIPSRNYLTFAALSPQAVPANPVFAESGSNQATGGFGFGGLRPSSNSVQIDGVSDDDEFNGGSRTQLSPEAISDFQIVNHGFAADTGGAAGGSIDVEPRQGTNLAHGDAFFFEQNSALNAIQPLGLYPAKPSENRFRAGVTLGKALRPDKTFYYLAAEQELANGQDSSDLVPATALRINAALPTGLFPNFALSSGLFPVTDQETELSGRLDQVFSPGESAMVRYAFTNARNVGDAFHTSELNDRSARGSSFIADESLNATLTSTLSTTLLNQIRFELAQRRAFERTEQHQLPGIVIPGIVEFGTPFAGDSRRFETHIEFEDSATLERHHHLIGAGAGVDRVALRARVDDGTQGLFVFPTLSAFEAAAPQFYLQTFLPQPNINFAEYRIKAYLEDHWRPVNSLSLDAGVRYEANLLPSNLPQDLDNFSPRLGIAWSATNSLVLRGGFGLFYDRYRLSTIDRIESLDGTRGFSQIAEDADAAAIYHGGGLPSQPQATLAPSIWQAQAGLHNPYSEVASLGIEQELPLSTTLKLEYQYVHGVHLGRTTNVNLPPPVTLTASNAAALGVSAPAPQQIGREVFAPARLNTAYDAINVFATSAGSSYNGATVTLNRQFTDDFEVLAGYTFSKTFDDASYETEQPQNPYRLGDERALSLNDQRHRLTVSGLWLLGPDLGDPQDAAANANPGPLMRVLNGFEFAPILSVTSGFREDPITGVDSNREHIYPFAARPFGFRRNSLKTPVLVDLDFRVLRMVALGRGHLDIVAESFNLLNHQNIALLNTAYGSGDTAAPGFARPIEAETPRRLQFSLDYEF